MVPRRRLSVPPPHLQFRNRQPFLAGQSHPASRSRLAVLCRANPRVQSRQRSRQIGVLGKHFRLRRGNLHSSGADRRLTLAKQQQFLRESPLIRIVGSIAITGYRREPQISQFGVRQHPRLRSLGQRDADVPPQGRHLRTAAQQNQHVG